MTIAMRVVVLWAAVATTACGDAVSRADDGTMLAPYLAIGDALAHDGTESIGALAGAIEKVGTNELREPGAEALVKGAERIGSQGLEAARVTFEVMSTGMIDYLQAHPEQQAGLVIVHCPMAFRGKGALWVQREGRVMNPYEGSRMLHCGETLAFSDPLPLVTREE